MIEDRNSSVFGRTDYAVDVDQCLHAVIEESALSARSHRARCFSDFAIRRGNSMGGSKPKWMFIGAKSLHGVETYRHKAPMADSAGNTTVSSPRNVCTAFSPATRPDATFSI